MNDVEFNQMNEANRELVKEMRTRPNLVHSANTIESLMKEVQIVRTRLLTNNVECDRLLVAHEERRES